MQHVKYGRGSKKAIFGALLHLNIEGEDTTDPGVVMRVRFDYERSLGVRQRACDLTQQRR